MSTYLGRPVEVIEDYGNGITRVKFLDAGKPYPGKYQGENPAERWSRIASHGILDVATDRVTED